MADNRKYYYMRLMENYFEMNEQLYLESLPDGCYNLFVGIECNFHDLLLYQSINIISKGIFIHSSGVASQ